EAKRDASRHLEGEDRHGGRSNDHANREDGNHQPGISYRDTQVLGDLWKDPGHHEFCGAHEEHTRGKHVGNKRQATGCWWAPSISGHGSRPSQAFSLRESRLMEVLRGTLFGPLNMQMMASELQDAVRIVGADQDILLRRRMFDWVLPKK